MQKVYITDAKSGHPAETFVFVPADEAKKLIESGQATSTETGAWEEEAKKKAEKEEKAKPAKAEVKPEPTPVHHRS